MRLTVRHATRYRFTEPQARIVQALRLHPRDTAHQTVAAWRIDIDRDAHLRAGTDGYGNAVHMLYAEGPLDTLAITVSGEVLLTDGGGRVEGVDEPFPPDLYRRATPLTAADDAVRALMDGIAGDGEGMVRLAARLRERGAPDRRPRRGIRSAAEAMAADRPDARDLAQLFVAAARSGHVPARYVAGYGLAADAEGRTAAPHAWAEAWVDGGWFAFDPSVGGRPGTDHVRVAVALDAAGAAPVSGTRIGAGDEVLDVDIHVADADG